MTAPARREDKPLSPVVPAPASTAAPRPAPALPAGGQFPPIGDLAFLSDGEAMALVAPSGNVEWMCLPRLDSPSVFGTLLDRGAGRFRVGPSDVAVPAERRYRLASTVVVTTWMSHGGLLSVHDALTVRPWDDERRRDGQLRPPGDVRPDHVLLRTIRCEHGSVEVTLDCEPMFDYGRETAVWSYLGEGYHAGVTDASGEAPRLRLDTSMRLGFEGGRAAARTTLRASQDAFVALSWSDGRPPEDVGEALDQMERTADLSRSWVRTGEFPDHPWRTHLQRSALTLKGLTYAPTGALAASPTTSLPRIVGGVRNWDYRYAFVRDSAAVLRAFAALGFSWEADDYLSFLAQVTANDRPLQTLYRVDGEDPPEETELSHLGGYRGSVPVRLGNSAAGYAQHDASGALLDAAAVYARARRRLPGMVWAMAQRQLEAVIASWREADRGFWYLREEPRHYTTTKLMCWVAAERASRLATLRGHPDRAARCRGLAAEIAADILEHGVSEQGAFREHYETDGLDASLLLIPLTGFLPGTDERVRNTVTAIGEELSTHGLILRRPPRPGETLAGETFTACSWWFVAALVTVGDVPRARSLAERLLTYASALGLYAEHLDPSSGRQLGNFPHAQTHLALIDALLRLIRAER